MTDNLPLIPEKGSVCADVRPILRSVFCELDCLPPLIPDEISTSPAPSSPHPEPSPPQNEWIDNYKSDCKEVWGREGELKEQHAKRISREPLPNIYKLHLPGKRPPQPKWRLDRGLIDRKDLIPTTDQNAGGEETLWIQNILNRSSGTLTPLAKMGEFVPPPVTQLPPKEDTVQSLSVGAVVTRPAIAPSAPPPPMPPPDYIVCVPPQLDFINFTIGCIHTLQLRLVNMSKFEIRLSLTPPKSRVLDVEISGPRGLTVTSGAAAEIRVHFRPVDVRALRDTLHVRVSMGRNFIVPIACFMQPPVLNIMIPSVTSSLLSCTPGSVEYHHPQYGGDVLELGSRLLGDVHCTRLLLHADADHASFFFLTEDAWLSFSLDCLSARGSVVAGTFVVWPAWWHGGGVVRGSAWCRADRAGLHAHQLRLLCSTAVVRPVNLLADALLFKPEHLSIQAHEKDYDIMSDGEPACEYYVNLGTAFPHRELSATVHLINHSPVVYSYYWSVRPWGECSCWEEDKKTEGAHRGDYSDRLCVGAREAREIEKKTPEVYAHRGDNAKLVRVDAQRGQILPRSTCAIHVHVPDVGERYGVQRAVLVLILKDIPRESFSPDYEPMIISTESVETPPIPGVKSVFRDVCEVVCAQMEVWWEVVPVRFFLEPPILMLHHSRRVESIGVELNATQLYGPDLVRAGWSVPARLTPPPAMWLTPAQPVHTILKFTLPSLPNKYPQSDTVTLIATTEEWQSQCVITRQCATRHPSLSPGRAWLGVVPPGAHMTTTFKLHNDTHQHICWWAEPYRWLGENLPSPACRGVVPTTCEQCREMACTCALLKPARGALPDRQSVDIVYDVNAPERDGCVATLVQVRRTDADVALVHGGPATEARAALVAYRVLAPRLVLRLLPCEPHSDCGGCKLDEGEAAMSSGTAILRPAQVLALGHRTCYRLHVANITPLPTALHFDKQHDSSDVLKVMFSPNEFSLRAYGEMDVGVILEARKVCDRRLFVYRAKVFRSLKPVYLVVDTAIAGLQISCQVPLGGELNTESFALMRRTQREEHPWEARHKPTTPAQMFAAEDRKRIILKDGKCSCHVSMEMVPQSSSEIRKPPPSPTNSDKFTIPTILTSPPPTRLTCPCLKRLPLSMPRLQQPICLQYTKVPLRTVRTRTLVLRNESVVTAHWSTAVRRWPRKHVRNLDTDQWSAGVSFPGVALQCTPARGVLAAHAHVRIHVNMYADCWGLYFDQLLIQVENLESIVLDVWIEVVGPPLRLALQPPGAPELQPLHEAHHLGLDTPTTLWVSSSDPERIVRAKNVSRAQLVVHVYVAKAYEYSCDTLPLRLYLRHFDVLPRTCPCLHHAYQSDTLMGEISDTSSFTEEMDTGFELYLAPDCGPQCDDYYKVTPTVCNVNAGETMDWKVTLQTLPHDEVTPDINLLLRTIPVDDFGAAWRRPEPEPAVVRLRHVVRRGQLVVSACIQQVKLCALDLPYGDVLRVRKRFQVSNVGNGPLELGVETSAPWCVLTEQAMPEDKVMHTTAGIGACGVDCYCQEMPATRDQRRAIYLEPHSCLEMCVEVAVSTAEVWPTSAAAAAGLCAAPVYSERKISTTPLHLYDEDNVLTTMNLVLELEYPVVKVEPQFIDFGFVTDGDTRKTYFSVSHTSRTATLELATEWIGNQNFKIWPPLLSIPPGGRKNVYLQYTAIWRRAPEEDCARVHVCSGVGRGDGSEGACGGVGGVALGGEGARAAWCRAAVPVRAAPARDHKCAAPPHDYTDDPHLLPHDMLPPHLNTKTTNTRRRL